MGVSDFPDDNKDKIIKAKKNLVYVGILSVVMFFGGLTSAYIVSMGDSFWLKVPLPNAFYISTSIIIISSIAIQLAIYFAKKGNSAALKAGISLTLLLGIGFVYFQFKGYGELVDKGVHAVGNIIVTDGKYGDYYTIKMDGKFVEIDGNKYLLSGKEMTDDEMISLQKFSSQFLNVSVENNFQVNQYGSRFELYYENERMFLQNSLLYKADSSELEYVDRKRLSDLAVNIRDRRGDFYVKGEIGKDFKIYYKSKELQYGDRHLQLDGRKLDKYLQLKAIESADSASSYLYIITFAHLLHIIVTIFYLLRLVIHSFSGKINSDNTISLKMGAIFWHFLGILWMYLLLFLLFIH